MKMTMTMTMTMTMMMTMMTTTTTTMMTTMMTTMTTTMMLTMTMTIMMNTTMTTTTTMIMVLYMFPDCVFSDPIQPRNQKRLAKKHQSQERLLTAFRGIVLNIVIAIVVYIIGSNNRPQR